MAKRRTADELLEQLAEDWGTDVEEMLREAVFDSVVPGICPYCGYSTDVEPDQRAGWCEECEKRTVISCLILGGIC